MKLEEVARTVDGIPWMKPHEARHITSLIAEHKPQHILELGFKHGVSSCYMAGALQENGGGHLTTIDLKSAEALSPNVDELLEKLGLSEYATVYYEETSYTWRLMEMLERSPRPQFDLCYLDGAHNWDTDGLAFFLVDKLLAENALLILDDLDWSYARSPTLQDEPWVKAMPREQYEMQQIRKVFDLLVCEHPAYTDFRVDHGWGMARKLRANASRPESITVTEILRKKEQVGIGSALLKGARAFKRRAQNSMWKAIILVGGVFHTSGFEAVACI